MPDPVAATKDIRAGFPALDRTCNGRPVAYFDGPGGTQVPRSVAEAMQAYLLHHNANTHWAFATSRETDALIANSRQAMADFLNCTPDEVVFGQNMTTLTFHVARALGRSWLPGDEVIYTELDHHANIDPWLDLAAERGLVARAVPFEIRTGQLDYDALEHAVTDRTRLIAVGGASNALGTVNDLPRVIRLARSAGAYSFVDAVHYAPHVLVDVQALDCDFLVCSPYKFYGPHAGVLYGRRAILEQLAVPRLRPAGAAAPERLETGTLSHEAIVGAAAAVDFLASLAGGRSRRQSLDASFRALHRRGAALLHTLWEGLQAVPQVTCYGPAPEALRTPTIGFTIDGITSEAACAVLGDHGLFLSHGDFYATTVVERLGIEGLIRAGCACYTNNLEVERLLDAVTRLVHTPVTVSTSHGKKPVTTITS